MWEKLRSLSWWDAVLIMGLMCVVVGLSLQLSEVDAESLEIIKAKEMTPTVMELREVIVEVVGGVERPGVYRLKEDARVVEALAMAGGLSAEADREWLEKNMNRSRRVRDGEKIYIKRVEELEVGAGEVLSESEERLVSLNEADSRELDTLPGVGEAMAGRIIKYREDNGGFKNIEEIKLVSGVGEKMYEEIKELISL